MAGECYGMTGWDIQSHDIDMEIRIRMSQDMCTLSVECPGEFAGNKSWSPRREGENSLALDFLINYNGNNKQKLAFQSFDAPFLTFP